MADSSFLDNYEKTGHVFSEAEHTASERLVRESFYGAKEDADAARRLEAERRLDAYEDDFRDVLKARISATYEQPNAADLVKVLDSTNNPLKRIVNEISALYAKPPIRKLAKDSDTATWRKVLKLAGERVVMPRLNRMTDLLNDCLLYVRPSQSGSLTLKLVLAKDCTVWPDPDDPTMPLCVEF